MLPTFAGIFTFLPFVNEREYNYDDDVCTHRGPLTNKSLTYAWYLTLPALFNVGWAAVQISNMAIVNSLTYSNRRRDTLVNNRNGFTYGANITVLTLALIFFNVVHSSVKQFRLLSIITLIFGFASSIFYIVQIKEVSLSQEAKSLDKEYKKQVLGETDQN